MSLIKLTLLTGLLGGVVLLSSCASGDQSAKTTPLKIVDTHIHLYDPTREGGVEWPPSTDSVLYRPVLPEHYDAICDENDIAATIIVEASGKVEINQWILDITRHRPQRYLGLVGNLPIGTPAFRDHIDRFSQDARFVGIRMRQRPGGKDFFTDTVWSDLNYLAEKNLTLDVLMENFSLEEIAQVAARIPTLKILINHLTGLTITGSPADPSWVADVQQVAKHPNVYCKVSGIFQRSGQMPSPKNSDYYAPIFETIYAAFGQDRIIYGSNWPVTDRGGRYDEQLSIIRNYFAGKGDRVVEKLFAVNAIKFYDL